MKNIVCLFACIPTIIFSQHTVEGTFSPPENFTYALLYCASPTSLYYVDRAPVESDGTFKIALDSTAKSGIYKLVYGLPQDENNFDFIYDGKEDIVLDFSLNEGLEFKKSVENKLWASYTKSMELVNMTISNYYSKESTDKKAFKDIFKTLNDTQTAFEDASKGTMAATFIKANKPYIPIEHEDITTYSNNLKATFFTNVDFGNPLLQSSDFLTDRVMAYVFGMSASNSNAQYQQQIDGVMRAIGNDRPIIATSLFEHLWKKMIAIENTEVAEYIIDTYLQKLAKETRNEELLESIRLYKTSATGTLAYNFAISYQVDGKPVNTSLHQLSGAERYLLIFWSSTCGHCLDELPKVKTYLSELSKSLKVIAFGIEEESTNWTKTISQFPDFIHVLGLQQWNNPIRLAYGVNSTPSYFVLDADKKILAKPDNLEALKSALQDLK